MGQGGEGVVKKYYHTELLTFYAIKIYKAFYFVFSIIVMH